MADFVQNTNVKSAVRPLATPVADVTTFNSIVESIITANPFGCVPYMTAGENHAGVEKVREAYTLKIVFQDTDANVIGNLTDKYTTVNGFTAGATALLADTALIAAHNGTPARDTDRETYSATLKCHDENGEIYNVTLSRDKVTISSYEDDAILVKVETWADSVAALA
ncbi:MAG TPA: hypothetical protein PKM50_03625 [Methanoregula sp.]|nr:hypothetical protein [Methanoregula sp.]